MGKPVPLSLAPGRHGGVRYQRRQEVDFVIVGSGSAGGILARELSVAGFSVVVLEQGLYRRAEDFEHHDDFATMVKTPDRALTGSLDDDPQTFRASEHEVAAKATGGPVANYARTVGGSSAHFTGNFWRLRPLDFKERSLLGDIPGTGFADWPIAYQELEPYYTKVDWEIGVSGEPGPFDPPRSQPYPLPPLPVKSSGVLFEKGCRALGLHPQAAPMAILSRNYNGRRRCYHCGFCLGFGCEFGAKSSTLFTTIPEAEATGRCEIRTGATACRVPTDDDGRVTGVAYFDSDGREHLQRARAVVLSANGAETSRLLLMSESSRFPHGLANSSGLVGKYLMFNGGSSARAVFDEPLNEFKSVQVTRIAMDFYETDPERGFYGGGGIDGRWIDFPVTFGLGGLPPDAPRWGARYKRMLGEYFNYTMDMTTHATSLPVASNNVTLDPTHKDVYGRPGIRITYRDHDDDLATMRFLRDRGAEVLEAAGARRVWKQPVRPQTSTAHLLGTCRMGDDPAASVVDRYHRAHDVPNLFICDGSSMVSSSRGQPTMTIMALAFRAGEHIARFASQGDI